MKIVGRLIPPKAWSGSDGCSGVPDHYFRECCEKHDWGYRHLRFAAGMTDERARVWVDERLRLCMWRAVHDTAPDGWLACAAHYARWSWRPRVWWFGVRMFGGNHWTPIAERDEKPRIQT